MAWFFFTEGFVSIVSDRDDADNLLVRARTEDHLLAFLGRDLLDELGRDVIRTTLAGDYFYRAFIPRSFAVQRVSELTMGINYDNFKNTLRDEGYHDAAFEVWSAMHDLQTRARQKAQAEKDALLQTAEVTQAKKAQAAKQKAENLMERLPDWSDLPEDIRVWVEAQEPSRQAMWVELRDYPEVKEDPSILPGLLQRYRDNDAICAAIAGTGTLTAEEEKMGTIEFGQILIERSQRNTATSLPTWEHVRDPDLLAWLRELPEAEQLKLADLKLDLLDRARGDALMGEVIAATPLRIPFPPAWESFTDQEKDAWRNDIYVPQMRALVAEDVAARRATEAAT